MPEQQRSHCMLCSAVVLGCIGRAHFPRIFLKGIRASCGVRHSQAIAKGRLVMNSRAFG